MDKQDSLTSTQGGEDGETTAQRLSIFWFLLNKFGQPVDTELLNIWKYVVPKWSGRHDS